MSGFPYTDEQVRQTARAFWPGLADDQDEGDYGWARKYLQRLHEVGIAVTFPKSRFYVDAGAGTTRHVFDRESTVGCATFYGPSAERYAREHADRLNREVSR